MLRLQKPDVILVQNPPALPALPICWIAARLRGAKLVIDWHNFSHSMVALRLGARSLPARLLRRAEMAWGQRADAHLCVSLAMKLELARRWTIPAVVFRDRPAEMFSPTPPQTRPEVWRRYLGGELPAEGTRPAIIVCPTGWTADEDLSILIDAAAGYDELARASRMSDAQLPRLLILISGQGPLRARYEERIGRMRLDEVNIRTLWLPLEEYALLIGSADLGVSCHRSASGVDLAMKIADMFGAGLPVCALDYGAGLAEQVRQRENGLVFKDSEELTRQLCELLKGFPQPTPLLESLRETVALSSRERWREGWQREAAPVLLG